MHYSGNRVGTTSVHGGDFPRSQVTGSGHDGTEDHVHTLFALSRVISIADLVEGRHELSNGLLLRSDLHKLFDLGYVTVDPDEKKVVVSSRIREEFENGRDYYALHGRALAQPQNILTIPSIENLTYHASMFSAVKIRP